MEEAHYKENLELEDQSKDSGGTLSLEMVRDSEGSEGEVGQEVIGVDSGGSSRSGSESLERLANVELLVGRDDVRNSTMIMKKG